MRRILFAAWTLIAAFLLLEVGTRLLGDRDPELIRVSQNPRLVYELDPSHPQVNSHGLRGREIEADWLEDAFVIAAIGDSHTYSVRSTSYENGYPAQLERMLRKSQDRGAVVLNFGVPGYNTAQQLEVLRARALAFEPDLVLLQFTQNDTHVCNYIHPRHPRLNQWIHRSHFLVHAWKGLLYRLEFGGERVFRFVARHFPDALLFDEGLVGTMPDVSMVHPSDDPQLVPERYHYMLGRENLKAHLREFSQLASERGIARLATGFIEPEDERLFESAGFDVLPFARIFEGVDMRRYGYRPDHSGDHFTDTGSAFVATALARFIRQHYLLSPSDG